jgi:hypothetical protein
MSINSSLTTIRKSGIVKAVAIHVRCFALWFLKSFAMSLARDLAKDFVGWFS